MIKPDIKTIIKNHLERNGFVGMYNERVGCWCSIKDGDLCSCEDIPTDCKPGYKVMCEDCGEECESSYCVEFCIKEKKENLSTDYTNYTKNKEGEEER